jgi:hypothetical protein
MHGDSVGSDHNVNSKSRCITSQTMVVVANGRVGSAVRATCGYVAC